MKIGKRLKKRNAYRSASYSKHQASLFEDNDNGEALLEETPATYTATKTSHFLDLDHVRKFVDLEENKRILGSDLTFIEYPEWQRTKHVHRLHPYLGKFIPQLVEVFLQKFFKRNDIVLDPFGGSGTTLIEANALGINAVSIELSPFNVLIQEVKTQRYNLQKLEKEVLDILSRTRAYSRALEKGERTLLFGEIPRFTTTSHYLKGWFAERSLQEILFYRSLIPGYQNQDPLKIILTRSARSARLIPHYDLARPKEPIREKYWCIKHNCMCEPIQECLKFINRYSYDTIKRIRQFEQIRTSAFMKVYEGDARTIELDPTLKFDGIFTSPPYVGMIDYHEQHRYAYELFPLKRHDNLEIGPMSLGRSKAAQQQYQTDMVKAFQNCNRYLKRSAKIFIVANDTNNLYLEIGKQSGYKLVDVFHRPVSMRTERDTAQYFESIFYFCKTS